MKCFTKASEMTRKKKNDANNFLQKFSQLGKSLSRNASNGISRWQESRCLIPTDADVDADAKGEIGLKQNRMYDHFTEVCLQSK